MKLNKFGFAAVLVGAMVSASPTVGGETLYMAGILDCVVRGSDAGAGDRTHDISCVLDPGIGSGEVYFGIIKMKPLAVLGDGTMQWMAFSTKRIVTRGIVAGKYQQVKGEDLWYGLGVDALIDDKKRFVLQPVAGRKNKTEIIASGVKHLEIASLGQ